MLGKLMKYELRATSRLMLPLLALVLLLGVGIGFGNNLIEPPEQAWLVNLLSVLFLLAFVAAIVASAVCAIVLMVQRFSKNLMGDEGYLMFTLPVSQHAIIISKLLTSLIWFIAVGIFNVLALLLAVWSGDMKELFDSFGSIWQQLMQNYAGKTWLVIGELSLLGLLSGAAVCLQFYAAIAVGHSFAQHKVLLSVVTFFGLGFVQDLISGFLVRGSARLGLWTFLNVENGVQYWLGSQRIILFLLAFYLIIGAALYVLTWLMTKKRLNLQ